MLGGIRSSTTLRVFFSELLSQFGIDENFLFARLGFRIRRAVSLVGWLDWRYAIGLGNGACGFTNKIYFYYHLFPLTLTPIFLKKNNPTTKKTAL